MNTRSSILTAALLCIGLLASAPVANAQYPADCVTVNQGSPADSSVDQACLSNPPIPPTPPVSGPYIIQAPTGDMVGGSDGCGLDAGTPTPVVGPVNLPNPQPTTNPCMADFVSVTITGEGAATVVHIHFFQPERLTLPTAPFSDGQRTIEDLYLSASGDFDGDGLSTQMELSCPGGMSNPLNPASTCKDTDADGLEYYTAPMTASECTAAGGTFTAGECRVDEETACPGHDPGQECDPKLWDTDGDGLNDKDDDFPTDASNGDPDGDGLMAAAEASCGTDPAKKDTDSDGLHDGIECGPQAKDTNPLDPDTDDDGHSDGAEVDAGTDPTNASSFPVQGPDGCLVGGDGPEGLCGFPVAVLDEEQRTCDPTDSQFDPESLPDCVPAGSDPCAEDPPIVCDGPPSTDPCDYDPPVGCGGEPPAGSPADQTDPWDTNGNGKTLEPNGQVDAVELSLFYYDFDEAASSPRERNQDLEGTGGTVPPVTLVVWKPTLAGTPQEAFRVRIGDAGPAAAGHPIELLVIEEGPRGSPTAVTCLYTDGGQPYVAVRNGAQFDGSKANEPCGPPVNAIADLNAIGAELGDIVGSAVGLTNTRPLFEVTDGNGDGVPESFTLNLPDPADCAPGTPPTCSSYAEPLVLPPAGAPSPDDLCGPTGSFPGCLVPDDCADPADCVPEPPCDPGDPDCVPTPEDPAGDVIPPCSEVDTTQPAYVCFTGDEAGGAVTKHLEMNKIMVVLPGRDPIFL